MPYVYPPDELHTPDEWQILTDTRILDADGWSGKNGRPWSDPIDFEEWSRRASSSTQQSKVPEHL